MRATIKEQNRAAKIRRRIREGANISSVNRTWLAAYDKRVTPKRPRSSVAGEPSLTPEPPPPPADNEPAAEPVPDGGPPPPIEVDEPEVVTGDVMDSDAPPSPTPIGASLAELYKTGLKDIMDDLEARGGRRMPQPMIDFGALSVQYLADKYLAPLVGDSDLMHVANAGAPVGWALYEEWRLKRLKPTGPAAAPEPTPHQPSSPPPEQRATPRLVPTGRDNRDSVNGAIGT